MICFTYTVQNRFNKYYKVLQSFFIALECRKCGYNRTVISFLSVFVRYIYGDFLIKAFLSGLRWRNDSWYVGVEPCFCVKLSVGSLKTSRKWFNARFWFSRVSYLLFDSRLSYKMSRNKFVASLLVKCGPLWRRYQKIMEELKNRREVPQKLNLYMLS